SWSSAFPGSRIDLGAAQSILHGLPTMSSFRHLPLGTRIPDRLHAVSCSLPTMRDVIGYEEKEAATIACITSGYPRFVVHPLLGAIEQAWRKRFGLGDDALWVTSSRRMAEAVATLLAPARTRVLEHDGVNGVAHDGAPELRARAKAYLQHTGGFLSSRAAQDYAARHGIFEQPESEETEPDDAPAILKAKLTELFAPAAASDILLASSGMNAFWAAFRAVSDFQRQKGRDTWLQAGWLYLDTAAILAKFTHERHVHVFDVTDKAAIEAVFREQGSRLAGVVTEVTTNPLIHTADLPWLAGLARAHGACMIVDPSIVSAYNVDVAPHADIVLNSLTKYVASEGDVIAGAVVLTPQCPSKRELRTAIAAELEPVYARDLARLAFELRGFDALMPKLNENAREVVDYLRGRKRGLRQLYWSLQDGSRENYLRLARAPDRIGPVISFVVEGSMERFYDAAPFAKGPSFGMRTSLLSPFVYLAHYDLVSSESGRRMLAKAQLPADLLRFSVGAEPVGEIIDALETGFAAAG
ncbi:MAG: PLP-dependent transferase, partial [Opitutaceae bacterium]